MLTIRPADKVADAETIIAGARLFAAAADLPDVLPPLESLSFADAVMRLVEMPQTTVLLAEDSGVLAGGIGLMVMPYLWNPSLLAAEELFWWCRPGAPARTAMALLRAGRALAVDAGVKVLSFGKLNSSPAAVDGVYRRMGMRPVQTSYLGLV